MFKTVYYIKQHQPGLNMYDRLIAYIEKTSCPKIGALAASLIFTAIRNAPDSDLSLLSFVTHAETFFIKNFENFAFSFLAFFFLEVLLIKSSSYFLFFLQNDMFVVVLSISHCIHFDF